MGSANRTAGCEDKEGRGQRKKERSMHGAIHRSEGPRRGPLPDSHHSAPGKVERPKKKGGPDGPPGPVLPLDAPACGLLVGRALALHTEDSKG